MEEMEKTTLTVVTSRTDSGTQVAHWIDFCGTTHCGRFQVVGGGQRRRGTYKRGVCKLVSCDQRCTVNGERYDELLQKKSMS